MTIHILSGTITTDVVANTDYDTWILRDGAGIYSTNGLFADSPATPHSFQRFVIEGSIAADATALSTATGTTATVTITSTGVIDGGVAGFFSSGDGLFFSNAGSIGGWINGVSITGNEAQLVNTGIISSRSGYAISDASGAPGATQSGTAISNSGQLAGRGGIVTAGGQATIDNSGAVFALTSPGIVARSGDNHITNSGTIESSVTAVQLEGSGNTLFNSGTITSHNTGALSAVWLRTAATETARFTNDTTGAVYTASAVAVLGGAGNETILNRGLIDGQISTGDGNDVVRIIGGTVNGDVLLGNGNDTIVLKGGTVSGALIGDQGNDTYVIDDAAVTITETALLGSGTDLVKSSVTYQLGDNVENLTLTGGGNIDGTGNWLDNSIIGNAGANILSGFRGDDGLAGGAGDDVLRGGAGNDSLDGSVGNDTLLGGRGNDNIGDISGDNLMKGGAGDDAFVLADGANTVAGGQGNDSVGFILTGTGATIDLAAQANNAGAAQGATFSSVEVFVGTGFRDVFKGNNAANAFRGGNGNDVLNGRGGQDALAGEGGGDVLTGGAGADRFVYNAVSDSIAGQRDKITDFTAGTDVIDLSAIDADTGTAGDQAFTFIGGAAFSGTAGELRAASNATNTFVSADVNGDGAADFVVLLNGVLTLTAADFVL